MVATRGGPALGVLVADCVPVLLADSRRQVIAVSHAGRAGLDLEVLSATVQAMRERGGDDIHAAIGPCICALCYEVPESMQAEFSHRWPQAAVATRWGSPGIDLRATATAQLFEAGVARISQVELCTRESPELFSHRRARAQGLDVTGRFAGVVALA